MPSVTAILIAYNSEKVIGPAIASLLADPLVTKVMVVDNCSQDGIRSTLRHDFPKVTLIENPRNDGYGRAANVALTKVDSDFALMCNPDAVMNSGAVETLLRSAITHPDAAILAPALYNEHGVLHISFKHDVFRRERRRSMTTPAEAETCVDFVSGAVMLLNMTHMRRVGFFDPNIFLYYEDDDICLRARRAGHSIIYVPQARAMHLMGASSGGTNCGGERFKQRHMVWSRLYIEEKYQGLDAALLLAGKLRRKYGFRLAFYRLQMNRMKMARYKGRLEGIADFTAKAHTRQAA